MPRLAGPKVARQAAFSRAGHASPHGCTTSSGRMQSVTAFSLQLQLPPVISSGQVVARASPFAPGTAQVAQQSWDDAQLRELYPAANAAYNSGMLQVSDVHRIAYWQYGNPKGLPVLLVHGGPGAATFVNHARFCDPKLYRIICFDQRGCGQSTPQGCLIDNSTRHLVEDIEKLRTHLNVDSWMVFGGSWGVALSLAYAITHPKRVQGLLLRGVCLMRKQEIDWVFRGWCRKLFPAAWDAFVAGLSKAELEDPLRAYYARLTSQDTAVQQSAAKRCFRLQASLGLSGIDALQVWTGRSWERCSPQSARLASGALPLQAPAAPDADSSKLESFSGEPDVQYRGFPAGKGSGEMAQQLLTIHYSMSNGFMPKGGLLKHIDRIRHIPTIAVQGREDMVCPVEALWDLHKAWPELEAQIVPEAGHSMYDARIRDRLLQAQERMHGLLSRRAAKQ